MRAALPRKTQGLIQQVAKAKGRQAVLDNRRPVGDAGIVPALDG